MQFCIPSVIVVTILLSKFPFVYEHDIPFDSNMTFSCTGSWSDNFIILFLTEHPLDSNWIFVPSLFWPYVESVQSFAFFMKHSSLLQLPRFRLNIIIAAPAKTIRI